MDPGAWAVGLLSFALFGGEPLMGPGQVDAGFMWYRLPNGTCARIDTSKYNQLPKLETWMNGYVYADIAKKYMIEKQWLIFVDPQLPMCQVPEGGNTQGLYGVTPPPPIVIPPPPAPPVTTVIVAPAGSITDTNGDIWTFGTATSTGGNSLLKNGTATGGFGSKLQLTGGKIYTLTLQTTWYLWTGITWQSQATAPQ